MLDIFKDVRFCYEGVFGYDLVYTPIEMNLVPNQEVPWRTPWYNYGKNFVCIDVESEKLAKLVVFRDGKYKETIQYDEHKLSTYSDAIMDSDIVIDKYGNNLDIEFRYQLSDYINSRQEWYKTEREIQEEYSDCTETLKHRIIETVKSKDVDYQEYISYVTINMRCDYGAYLYLVATSDNDDDLLSNARFCIEHECPISLKEYFTWNDTPVTERSALAKAHEKIMKYKGGEE